MKPRVMSFSNFLLVPFGLLMAPKCCFQQKDAIIGIILVSIGAGAAGALKYVVTSLILDAFNDKNLS